MSVCSNVDEYDSRIKVETLALTLATGGPQGDTHNINPTDQIPDLHADGAPIVLEAEVADAAQTETLERKIEIKNEQRAQIWSFRPVAELPLADGTYQILNSRTGTVLGVAVHNGPGTYTLNIVSIHLQVLTSPLALGQQSQANQPKQKVRHETWFAGMSSR